MDILNGENNTMNDNMADFEPSAENNAVNVYQNDMADEFPVLKAFQQYIDAEQAKARKRMMMLCAFFSFILTVVVSVFVFLLIASSSRNQTLNDRLVEYAMKERERTSAKQEQTQENAVLAALTSKLEALQKSLAEDRARSEKAAEEAAASAKERSTAEALEIERLKALLAAEKEKAAAEREKQRQAELEAYRRKQYPEFYGQKPDESPSPSEDSRKAARTAAEEEADREIESIINDIKAIDYFDEEDAKKDSSEKRTTSKKDIPPSSSEDDVEISSGIKDSSGKTWNIPEE